jgi:lipopolysaccharide/colanic/teichoic acid biosynthesis glycosyltransferase
METHINKKIQIVGIALPEELNLILNELHIKHFSYRDAIHAYHDMIEHHIHFNLILINMQVPGVDIASLVKEIRADFSNQVLILGVAQNGFHKWNFKSREMGLDDVLNFPFTSLQLQEKINYFLSEDQHKTITNQVKPVRMNFLKRAFDFLMSASILLLISPILIFVAILIKLDSKGPVFFISRRVGKNYQVFDFYKFRTMRTDAEALLDQLQNLNAYATEKETISDECPDCKNAPTSCSTLLLIDGKEICERHHKRLEQSNKASFLKIKNDPRVTKLGAFLRNTSIDELPQLFNILKGDMSFVGNRPLPVYEAEQLTSDEWAMRFNAPAGLTGLWQVRKRGRKDMSELERKQLDNSYAKNHTFLKDLRLILQTIPVFIQKENV